MHQHLEDGIETERNIALAQFHAMILDNNFPCVGGASAVRRGLFRFSMFHDLGTPDAVVGCGAELRRFVDDHPVADNPVAVFVASFHGPLFESETDFESRLWEQLQGMHDCDDQPAWWDPEQPLAERDDDLGFLFHGRNFFVVGLHPAASRWSRRFGWPTLVFNALSHSDAAVEAGQFDRLRDRIRARDTLLQGSVSPTTAAPQVAQFSGRDVGHGWQCPLRPRDR